MKNLYIPPLLEYRFSSKQVPTTNPHKETIMMEVDFKLTENVQRERAATVKRWGGVYHNHFYRQNPAWAGNLLGYIAATKPSQYLALIGEDLVIYKGPRQTLFQDGGGAVLAYIVSGVAEFCFKGIKLHPQELTPQMRYYLPLLEVTRYKTSEPLLWYEEKMPAENRFEGITGW